MRTRESGLLRVTFRAKLHPRLTGSSGNVGVVQLRKVVGDKAAENVPNRTQQRTAANEIVLSRGERTLPKSARTAKCAICSPHSRRPPQPRKTDERGPMHQNAGRDLQAERKPPGMTWPPRAPLLVSELRKQEQRRNLFS